MKREYKTHIGNFSFTVNEGQFIRITWEKGICGRKEFSSNLQCFDATHFIGVAPFHSYGMNKCRDVWHIDYVPYKENIKSIEVVPEK